MQAFNNSLELSCDVKYQKKTLLQKCKQYMILIVSFDLERLKKRLTGFYLCLSRTLM